MQLTSLLPLLTLLATASPALSHSPLERRVSGGVAHQRISKLVAREETAALHARAAQRISANVEKRETNGSDAAPRALKSKPRKVKRGDGAKGCRPRDAQFTPSQSASPAASSTAPPSQSPAPTDNSNQGGDAQPSDSSSNLAADAQVSVGVNIGGGGDNNNNNNGGGGGGSTVHNNGALTPNGRKAGLSGTDMIGDFKNVVSWFWNYQPTADADWQGLTFVPTLWGNGNTGGQDWSRLESWKSMDYTPPYVQGFYEPDCSPPMSSSIDPQSAAPLWNQLVAPYKAKGAMLISPGMCKQADEDWLQPFLNAGAQEWDITSIHINKLSVDQAAADIDHYWNTYGKPIWVTEFACVDDQNGFTPSSDQGQINAYINGMVDLMENDDRIYAYSMSEGMGLGDVWPPYKDGHITESGQTYLNALSKYY